MPICKFTTTYADYEIGKTFRFYFACQEEDPLASGFCIFHDKYYLHHYLFSFREEHKRKVLDRFKHKVNDAISNKKPLFCIGFQLPDFNLSDLSIRKEFTKPVYFNGSEFFGEAYFYDANFQGQAYFHEANFKTGEADFYGCGFYDRTYFSGHFNGETKFHYVLFEGKEKVIFEVEDLSNVSFMNTDLTGVRFSDEARWGEKKVEYHKFWRRKKVKEDRFKIRDERILEEKIKGSDGHTTKDFNLGSIKAVYRSLRENYENRMRWDEAGQFFIREMELKRMYREVPSKEVENSSLEIKQNNWFRRNLFSLTGWYYHLSRYGESLWRPTLAGLAIIILSTLFWSTQENPELKPWLPIFQDDDTGDVTKFVGFDKFGDGDHWLKAYERSIAGFIPLLSLGSNIHVGIIDHVIKIVGGAVVFALIAVALRRRFERRYRH